MKSPFWLPVLAIALLLSLGSFDDAKVPEQNALADDGSHPSIRWGADTWITAKVKAELAFTHDVDSTDLSVTTHHGIVVLTGVLANDIALKKAILVAKQVRGVTKVDASSLKIRG